MLVQGIQEVVPLEVGQGGGVSVVMGLAFPVGFFGTRSTVRALAVNFCPK